MRILGQQRRTESAAVGLKPGEGKGEDPNAEMFWGPKTTLYLLYNGGAVPRSKIHFI